MHMSLDGFVTEGIVSAIEQAKGAAGDKQVYVIMTSPVVGYGVLV